MTATIQNDSGIARHGIYRGPPAIALGPRFHRLPDGICQHGGLECGSRRRRAQGVGGTPVIIREDARIPPDASRCCLKTNSQEDMADKIHELLADSRLREAMTEQGLQHGQQSTWKRTVRVTLGVTGGTRNWG